MPIPRPGLRAAAVLGVGLVAALVLPDAGTVLGRQAAFLPSFLTAIVVADLLTAHLFVQQHLVHGDRRMLALAATYLGSALVVVPHALVFPGVVSEQGLFDAPPGAATWLWALWHALFPAGLALAFLLAPDGGRGPAGGSGRAVAAAGVAVVATLMMLTVLLVSFGEHLPTIIVADDYGLLSRTVGPWVIAVNAAALLVVGLRTRGRPAVERWVLVAAAASCADVVLTLFAQERFTVGWYAGRALSLAAASAVLLALVVEIGRLYRQVATSYARLDEQHRELTDSHAALSRSNGELDRFAQVVAHDLTTPLATLAGFAELLERRHAEGLDDTAREYLEHVGDGARRLQRMVAGMGAYASVRGDRPDLRLLSAEVDRRHGEVVIGPLPAVLGDETSLGQVFQNLLANALKFGDGAAPRVEVTGERTAGRVRIRVADDGVGVDPADTERIFELFDRGSRDPSAEGSGIGLAICRRVVERHDGTIVCRPRPGGGTVFEVALPAA